MFKKIVFSCVILSIGCAESIVLVPRTFAAFNCISLHWLRKKICKIKKELVIAEEYHDQDKIFHLKKALRDVQAYCTNNDLSDNLGDEIYKTRGKTAEFEQIS